MEWYPLLLTPPIKDNIWGGTRLKTEFGYSTDHAIAAEAWVLSCHKDGSSVVSNGACAGLSLPDVLDQWGPAALGEKAARFPYFPLLIKLIDAHDRLSIQVHPADDYAMRVEGEFGKTEMWYIVDCEPGAELIYGFSKGLTKEEFRRRIEDNTLTDVCNRVPVKRETCSLSKPAPFMLSDRAFSSPRYSRTPTPPIGCSIMDGSERMESRALSMWTRR